MHIMHTVDFTVATIEPNDGATPINFATRAAKITQTGMFGSTNGTTVLYTAEVVKQWATG